MTFLPPKIPNLIPYDLALKWMCPQRVPDSDIPGDVFIFYIIFHGSHNILIVRINGGQALVRVVSARENLTKIEKS